MSQHAAHSHHHSHSHGHSHAMPATPDQPRLIQHRWSLLLSGAGERLAVVGALLASLWAVTYWALQ